MRKNSLRFSKAKYAAPICTGRLTGRGTGFGKGLLLPSKLSYVAFQLHNK
ncbi:hypothetical protein HanXRQr2_Chr01g0045301 [Helianthus annuus]|uniref:Uncharacterized protein n=1 Tax=Helianthus annuus TaxID=4232 RepID=A0A9K3P5D2_HELAN|nr:hypothetical protein HanXRQr2_Chr01g0045301 [Helianthus annuus]KAJ0625136.1 hypothetical protein HanIR_Chr01g0050501 [Helianthus annuus]KAJ0958996.1 hypothetical protein HanPSC8_Chr01g0045021 [Helianthus annuus]